MDNDDGTRLRGMYVLGFGAYGYVSRVGTSTRRHAQLLTAFVRCTSCGDPAWEIAQREQPDVCSATYQAAPHENNIDHVFNIR